MGPRSPASRRERFDSADSMKSVVEEDSRPPKPKPQGSISRALNTRPGLNPFLAAQQDTEVADRRRAFMNSIMDDSEDDDDVNVKFATVFVKDKDEKTQAYSYPGGKVVDSATKQYGMTSKTTTTSDEQKGSSTKEQRKQKHTSSKEDHDYKEDKDITKKKKEDRKKRRDDRSSSDSDKSLPEGRLKKREKRERDEEYYKSTSSDHEYPGQHPLAMRELKRQREEEEKRKRMRRSSYDAPASEGDMEGRDYPGPHPLAMRELKRQREEEEKRKRKAESSDHSRDSSEDRYAKKKNRRN